RRPKGRQEKNRSVARRSRNKRGRRHGSEYASPVWRIYAAKERAGSASRCQQWRNAGRRISMPYTRHMWRFALPALLLLLFPVSLFAQVGVDPLTLDISPQFPAPYQIVTVTPNSTVVDLSRGSLSLYVNGALEETNTGTAPFSITMPGAGTPVKIE